MQCTKNQSRMHCSASGVPALLPAVSRSATPSAFMCTRAVHCQQSVCSSGLTCFVLISHYLALLTALDTTMVTQTISTCTNGFLGGESHMRDFYSSAHELWRRDSQACFHEILQTKAKIICKYYLEEQLKGLEGLFKPVRLCLCVA